MAEKPNGFNAGGLFAGDNGKAFFDWIGQNQRAQEIFMGLLEEFGKGMGLQNQVAQVQLGNAAVAAAGFRPGQYVSARQRREAILAATDPDKAAADKMSRLTFHGGIGSDGRYYTSFDQWVAAGGPDARKEFWKGMSSWRGQGSGRTLTKNELDSLNKSILDHRSAITVADAKDEKGNVVVAKRPSSGSRTERHVTVSRDGVATFTWGDPGGSNPAKNRYWSDRATKLSGSASRDKKMDEAIALAEEARKGARAAYGGGRSSGNLFGARDTLDWIRGNDHPSRGRAARDEWADRVYADFAREHGLPDGTMPMVNLSPVVEVTRPSWSPRPNPVWKGPAEWGRSVGDSTPYALLRGSVFSASKGGEVMRERGWLDAVFARADRAAMRGGRTRR